MAIPEARGRGASENSARAPAGRSRPPRGWLIPVAGLSLIFAGHLIYGALKNDVALSLNIAAAALLAACLITSRIRDELRALKGLAWPAGLFALTIAVALWTLTPWTPGGPHPVWAYTGIGPGASTIDRSATIMETIKLLGLGVFFCLGALSGARDDRAGFAIRLTIAAGVVFGLWALLGAATGWIVQSTQRLEAHFLNANTAGTVFAILLCLAMSEVSRGRGTARGQGFTGVAPAAAAAVTFAVCLLDSASRGAVAAALVAILAYVALLVGSGRLRLNRGTLGLAVGLGLLLLIVAIAGDQVAERFFSNQGDYVVRLETWRAHWGAFLQAPLFGYGLGAAETINKTLLTVQNYETLWSIRGILNVYLQWLEEAGIVGAAPMFLCIALIVWRALRGTFQRHRMVSGLCGLVAADVVVLVHGATDFGLEVFSVAAFWAWLLGLQFSLAQGRSTQ